jgi:hypothetical protein
MDRRGFLGHFAAAGYTVVVHLDSTAASASTFPPHDPRVNLDDPSRPAPSPWPAEPHMRLVDLETDVLVAGGGMAGVCASLAAARHGARVILVQDRSRLGGNASSEVRMHIVGANSHKGRPGWREGGILEELRLDDAVRNPERCWEVWDLLLYDKIVSEPSIRLLLDTTLFAAAVDAGRIRHVLARCDTSEHLYRIAARIFCDCTGDARLALEAGAEMRRGREGQAELGESLAPDVADAKTMGNSILFAARDHGKPVPFEPPGWARKLTSEDLRVRPTTSWEYGYWWIEWGGHRDTVADQQRIRFELLSIVMGVWDYIKNSGSHPSSANWGLTWVGMVPGRRESRRVVGDHLLTQSDLETGRFDDAVAIGGWPMDDHPPEGFDRPDLDAARQIRTPVYGIPLRCLYSRNIQNLMMAGRNISTSHVAFSSTRVMGTCAVLGQAVGTAAAACAREGLAPRDLARDRARVRALQQALLRDDQTIVGVASEDEADLARQAQVRASAEEPAAPARNVTNGQVRDTPGGEINRWSARLGSDGAWVELSWPRPQTVREVRITFDTGFQRELTLTLQDGINRGIVRSAQPETVRDYDLLVRRQVAGGLEPLAQVRDNHQRLRRHVFAPLAAHALRVHVRATNGDPLARIFEIRCYA